MAGVPGQGRRHGPDSGGAVRIIISDGEPVTGGNLQVDVEDSGFLYGDSLFETLRAEQGELIWVGQHLERIETACRLSGILFDRQLAQQGLDEVCRRSGKTTARVRLTVSRGGPDGRPRQLVTACPYQPPATESYRNGVDCVYAANRRVNAVSHLPQMKRGNYADCLYASRQARAAGAFEALFIEPDGMLQEGAISNLFLLVDGVLLTPPAGDLVLPGIARAEILKAAKKIGLPVREQPLHRKLLADSAEVMLSNSLFGLIPVRSIAGHNLPRGPLAATLRKQLGFPFDST
ncbi:hypothetical protein B5V00_02785 [Geothermobacter hydrogeniphilus]|uniref:branched-chain-amino-acid transaminase n=1 Tax=Geothermobacter hydrogeniphilus TaxID=1969733 RepID=A0A1X0YDD5_9BACT|nr:hypothetical protein B5V00_02785 [Geothermobacter hydrogeniphilus]